MSIPLDVILSPSRFDRADATLADVAAVNHQLVSIVLWTEVANPDRADILAALPGVQVAQERTGPRGMAECAITVGRDWEIVRWRAYEIGPDLGPGDIVNAVVALLRHRKSGLTLLAAIAHMPSAVEGSWRERGRRVTEYVKAVYRLRKIMRAWSREHRPDGVVLGADWNLSIALKWVRSWIAKAFPGLRLAEPDAGPGQGTAWTHAGRRLIDWFLIWGLRNVRCWVMKDHPHSDHRRTRLSATLSARKNQHKEIR